jgi:hypothetical protein
LFPISLYRQRPQDVEMEPASLRLWQFDFI